MNWREFADGGCLDEDSCAHNVSYCDVEIRSEEDMIGVEECYVFMGRLTVAGEAIGSLEELGNVREVRGVFAVEYTGLQNLNGLVSLEKVGGLYLANNLQLSDVSEMNDVAMKSSYSTTEDSSGEPGWDIHERGILWVENNPQLNHLDDLHGLGSISSLVLVENEGLLSILNDGDFEWVGLLRIVGNDNLTSISGLGNATHFRQLILADNDSLVDFSGLESLVQLAGSIALENNTALETLNGLSGTATVGDWVPEDKIRIVENPALNDIGALMNITSMTAQLEVTGNPALPSCDVKDLVDYLVEYTDWTVGDNVIEEDNFSDECSDLL